MTFNFIKKFIWKIYGINKLELTLYSKYEIPLNFFLSPLEDSSIKKRNHLEQFRRKIGIAFNFTYVGFQFFMYRMWGFCAKSVHPNLIKNLAKICRLIISHFLEFMHLTVTFLFRFHLPVTTLLQFHLTVTILFTLQKLHYFVFFWRYWKSPSPPLIIIFFALGFVCNSWHMKC